MTQYIIFLENKIFFWLTSMFKNRLVIRSTVENIFFTFEGGKKIVIYYLGVKVSSIWLVFGLTNNQTRQINSLFFKNRFKRYFKYSFLFFKNNYTIFNIKKIVLERRCFLKLFF